MERFGGFDKADGVPRPFGFEELPDGAHLHELRRLGFDIFDEVKEFEGFAVAFGKQLFEVAFETEMAAVEHEGIDVAPDLSEIGDGAGAAVVIGRGWDGDFGVDLRAAVITGRHGRGRERDDFRGARPERCALRGRRRGYRGW